MKYEYSSFSGTQCVVGQKCMEAMELFQNPTTLNEFNDICRDKLACRPDHGVWREIKHGCTCFNIYLEVVTTSEGGAETRSEMFKLFKDVKATPDQKMAMIKLFEDIKKSEGSTNSVYANLIKTRTQMRPNLGSKRRSEIYLAMKDLLAKYVLSEDDPNLDRTGKLVRLEDNLRLVRENRIFDVITLAYAEISGEDSNFGNGTDIRLFVGIPLSIK